MKIAHFINPWLPVTQNWIYNQIIYNQKCEHLILCRTLENQDQFKIDKIFPAHPVNGLRATLSMLLARARAQYPTGFYKSVISKEKPDILHGHFAWESWRNIQLIKKVHLPLVTTFYGLDVNKHPRKKCWRQRYTTLFDVGTIFTVEGTFMGKSLENLGCPADKIRVVHLGVDIERLLLCKRHQTNETFNTLFVGLGREKKGAIYAAEAFVKAAKCNESLRLHIIGDGHYRKSVEDIVTQGGVGERVTIYGYVSVNKYHEILANMDCIMAPSVTAQDGDTEGGAPVSVIEAQAIGIPVIGSTHCDIPDVVKHGKTGLLSPEKDVEKLASDLLLLTSDKSMYEQFCREAQIHALEQHDIKKQVEKLNNVYREALTTFKI